MGFFDKIKSLINNSQVNYDVDLDKIQKILGYHFKDTDILVRALTHRSYSHNFDNTQKSNERMEFLGDSVLGLAVASYLFRDNPEMMEGELTKNKAKLVNETTLFNIAKKIGLDKFLRLSVDEDRAGGRDRPSIVADGFESVIGAVYIDGGFEAASDIVFRLIYAERETIFHDKRRRNYKGALLELSQGKGWGMPRYEVVSESGPDHEKVFEVVVSVENKKAGHGSGSSKKEAEQKAAADAFKTLERDS